MSEARKQAIVRLLKGIETGDPSSVEVVDEAKYIQHNPQTHEGSEGLAALFARLAKTSPRVNVVRVFSDGDYVFGHTEYDFSTRRIGFEVFRFEGDRAVEHWDNIQPRRGPNPTGRSMVDGPTEATDPERTDDNRSLVRAFVEDVYFGRGFDGMDRYVNADLVQHHPELDDGLAAWRDWLSAMDGEAPRVRFIKQHRVLADGSFVLSVCEGERGGVHTAFYDLFRIEGGKIAEVWNTIEAVPPREQWKNDNGKF